MSYRPRRYPKHRTFQWRLVNGWYPNAGSIHETFPDYNIGDEDGRWAPFHTIELVSARIRAHNPTVSQP